MKKILVEISARHLHISKEHLEILFGEGHQLTVRKMLSQPGQYAAEEKVEVVGPKGSLKMTILGPVRPDTQIELSLTDARTIGVVAKVRESGMIDETSGCKIVGPCGEVEIEKGVICAKRHIHMTTEDAKEFNVSDKQIVQVKIETPERTTTYGDVIVRVRDDFSAAMHIDTDEGNAAGISGSVEGEIIV